LKVLILAVLIFGLHCASAEIVIGSKAFTEGYLLSELIAQTLEKGEPIFPITRRFGMGGTGILSAALTSGKIDLYPEYTGTISEVLLKTSESLDKNELRSRLQPLGLTVSDSLGFDNTYALAVREDVAQRYGLRSLSDLQKLPTRLSAGFSNEFASRADGWPRLQQVYNLSFAGGISSMEHVLTYPAVAAGRVDVIDVYTTDAQIATLHLRVLQDDRHALPTYQAVILARTDFVNQQPLAWKKLTALQNTLSAETMMKLNGLVVDGHWPVKQAIEQHLGQIPTARTSIFAQIWARTVEHLLLVSVALLFSTLVGVPLGILAARRRVVGQWVMLFSGWIQTIPSLALLCFLIPLSGIGLRPALIALCLYGLLPIVVNTFTGLQSIDPLLLDMSRVLGLTHWQSLWRLQLPLASRSIIAGVKTSAIIGIGMATLAALIGAGGYGAPILMGLTTGDMATTLQGAIPASLLAVLVNFLFVWLEKFTIPRGLR
jgi:osmoprotectant transport system permease protein